MRFELNQIIMLHFFLSLTGSLLAVIFGVWVLASFAGLMVAIPVQTGVTGLIITVAFLFVPLIVILAAYGKIFRIARAHARGRGVTSLKKVPMFKPVKIDCQCWFNVQHCWM